MHSMCSVIDKTGVFHRERSAGLYRLSAYYLAMVTTEIPMTCILPTMYVTVIYWMVGLTPTAENFIFVWLIVLLNVFMSQVGLDGLNDISFPDHYPIGQPG